MFTANNDIGIEPLKKTKGFFFRRKISETPRNLPLSPSPIATTKDEGELATDIFQNEKALIVLAPIAGIKLIDLNVNINNNILTIRGNRKIPLEITEENYLTRECFWGNFSRSIILPEGLNAKKIKAVFKNGILTVEIAKKEIEEVVNTIVIEE